MFSFDISALHGLSLPELRHLFRFARRRLYEEHLPQVAGSLTFTSVLALVPILTIALAIFTTFPLFNSFRTALEAYFIKSLMPKAIAGTILGYLNGFASKATRLSAVGAVALMVTAGATLETVERTFNQIWRVKKARPWTQRILVYWAIITLGPLLMGGSISVSSYLFIPTDSVFGGIPFIGAVLYTLISILLTTGAYTLLYASVPNRSVNWQDAACGGLLAALAFEIAKRLFAVYIARFPTYTMIYGTLAAIPIFLVWIYLSWFVTLMGAVVVAALPVIKYERWWHVPSAGSEFVDAMALLKVLHRERSHGQTAAVNAANLRAQTRLGYDEMEALLEKMLDAGWVGRIKIDAPSRMPWRKRVTQGKEYWTLLSNPEHLTLAQVYRLFVFDVPDADELVKKVETAVELGLHESLALYFAKP